MLTSSTKERKYQEYKLQQRSTKTLAQVLDRRNRAEVEVMLAFLEAILEAARLRGRYVKTSISRRQLYSDILVLVFCFSQEN